MKHLLLIGVWLCMGCLPDGDLKHPGGWEPEAIDGDWEVGTVEAVGLDRDSVEQAVTMFQSEDHMPLARALVVVRSGRLVVESYVRPEWGRDDLQYVKSVTKSLTSLGLGLAIADGAIEGVDAPLLPVLGRADVEGSPTFADFATMRAGLNWDNESTNKEFLVDLPADSIEFALGQGFTRPPGERFAYNDGETHLVGGAIGEAVGAPLDEYLADRVFTPLGIYKWDWYRHVDGVPYGAFGLWLRPRDMAKIGQLIVNRGAWGTEQLVPEPWIDESTMPRVPNDTDDAPVYARGYPYGYFWWHESSRGAVIARGHGGQNIYVVPSEELVVVLTAEPFSSYEAWIKNDEADEIVDTLLDGAAPAP
jgi:CubicO group peptidase (beta-lactamase class C family)